MGRSYKRMSKFLVCLVRETGEDPQAGKTLRGQMGYGINIMVVFKIKKPLGDGCGHGK